MEIGIDIGGTKIAAGLVHNRKVLKRMRVPTPKTKTAVIAVLKRMIAELQNGKRLRIGIGVPGKYKGTRLLVMPNIPWIEGTDLSVLGHVTLDNDSRAFALAEHAYGAGEGRKSMIGIIIGTGFGSGIIIDGKLHHGARGIAGEIGHGIIDLSTKNYSMEMIKNDWCWLLSGPGILRRHHENGGREPTLALAWAAKTNAAKKTRDDTIRMLAIFLTNLQYLIDPEVIVIGGGVATHLPLVREVNKIIRRYGGVPVHQAKLEDAGIIGAALIAAR